MGASSAKISPDAYSRYAGGAENLLAFLGISDAAILVVGGALGHWRQIFPNSHFLEELSALGVKRGCYDLILYHSGSASTRSRLIDDLQMLKKLSGEHGQIFYFAENFLSISNFKQLLGKWNFSQLRRFCFVPSYFRKLLKRSSMPVAKEFIGIPKYQAAEEMVSPGSQFIEMPPNAHAVYRLAECMHRFHWIADGRIYLISNRSLENRPVGQTAAMQIQRYLNNQKCLFAIERFDMRLRGTLVIFITEQNTRKTFISRLVSDPAVQKIVRRNQNYLNFLHESSRLPAAIKKKIPEPISEVEEAAHTLFMETLIPGRLAWKVHQGSLRKVIFAEAVEFLTTLQLSMRQSMLLTPDHAMGFFREDVQRICSVKTCNPELAEGILGVVKQIRRYLTGRTFPLTISHGDYGYGNILVHPATGQLGGVIDWDTGRVNDLPGIDYLNLVLQKNRSEYGHSVTSAFRDVTGEVWRKGALDDKGFYAQKFDLSKERLKIVLYAGLIRYMGRAAQYPEVFILEQRDYMESLKHLEELAPL